MLSTGLVWFRRLRNVAIPEDRIPFVAAMGAGAILGAIALASQPGWIGGVCAVLALIGGALFVLTFAISAQRGGPGAFRVGQPLPQFSALDEGGSPFAVHQLVGRPILLKFFRGHW